MNTYRKKPEVIEAIQFTKGMAEGYEQLPYGVVMYTRNLDPNGHFPEYANDGKYLLNYDTCHKHAISTPTGDVLVSINDWIITDVNGEQYLCKPRFFEENYEPV